MGTGSVKAHLPFCSWEVLPRPGLCAVGTFWDLLGGFRGSKGDPLAIPLARSRCVYPRKSGAVFCSHTTVIYSGVAPSVTLRAAATPGNL
jgi:hypothetical protein